MVEDDIYGNKGKYERFKTNLEDFAKQPKENGSRKYYCKNPINLAYFRQLFIQFEARDISFIRRNRVMGTLKFIVHYASKDLAECTRDDINELMSIMHTQFKTPKSKEDFVKDIKHLWKQLLPEKDEKGRSDETIVPYPVRHLSLKTDKSKEKLRKDKMTWEEYEKILQFFSNEPCMQCFLALIQDGLSRPQETVYIKYQDVQIFDNYAKLYIAEHGKEGIGLIRSIDSFPYVREWYNKHPLKQGFFFVNRSGHQLTPYSINKRLRLACKKLELNKPISCYSLKRNGVTFKRLAGVSDIDIQHTARWTSTKQLKTYDMSNQEDSFKAELVRKGLIAADSTMKHLQPKTRTCLFCGTISGITDSICSNAACSRPLDRERIMQQIKQVEDLSQTKQFKDLLELVVELKTEMARMKEA